MIVYILHRSRQVKTCHTISFIARAYFSSWSRKLNNHVEKNRKRNTEYYFTASYCFIYLSHSPWPQDLSPLNCGLTQQREHINKYRSFKNEQHLKLNSKSKLQWIPNVFGSTFLCFTLGHHCRLGSEHMYAQSVHHAWCHTAQYQAALSEHLRCKTTTGMGFTVQRNFSDLLET